MVTTDSVVFTFQDRKLQVLLLMNGPDVSNTAWTLPGGVISSAETIEDCSIRVLRDEAGVDVNYLQQVKAYCDFNRESRESIINVTLMGLVRMPEFQVDHNFSRTRWFNVNHLPEMPREYITLINDALVYLKERIFFEPIAFELLTEYFTMGQVQCLYETILETEFDRRNFAKKMNHSGFLTPRRLEAKAPNGRSRIIYKFNDKKYKDFKQYKFRLEF